MVVTLLQQQKSYEYEHLPKIKFSEEKSISKQTTTTMAIISNFQNSIPTLTQEFELPSKPISGYCRVKLIRSQICNSDRRVLAGTKQSTINQSTVLGHEGIGIIEELSNNNKQNDLKIGDLVVLGPHFVEENDIYLKRGLPNLSCQMKHMGIHINGVFANKMDFPEYTLNKIIGANEIIQQTTNLNDYYDQMVLIEPLACVQRGYKLLEKQNNFNIKTIKNVLILGAGPMGIIHAIHIQKIYPNLHITITDIDPIRRKLAKHIRNLKINVVNEDYFNNDIEYDLIIVATSNRKANTIDSIRLIKNNGFILLFSGIDMKETDSRPIIGGIDIETIHRYEYSVQLINYNIKPNGIKTKSIYFIGTSGYVKEDFHTSIQELHDDFILDTQFRLYKNVITSMINKLNGYIVHDLTGIFHDITYNVPAIIPLLQLYNEDETYTDNSHFNVHNHLKILIRH
ncbi:unnamed protein product [Rotaria socialis]|uniref:Alcohol dehydrogenase-like N-terminal domain-containing protein n=1 Tax=Rotaria socialis TaxID=392032 RepID=A0A821U2T8_9BILA|nr:unnamed protein product [Rotaria socialis]CAF3294294.1 unnamed protein product [Rotaria socialis]CAF4389564.1 unnamed protein product [Rotaria socialis]CAF4879942.1 unnamed protein product [Rotaria socialis]